jgi:hypothetical protein
MCDQDLPLPDNSRMLQGRVECGRCKFSGVVSGSGRIGETHGDTLDRLVRWTHGNCVVGCQMKAVEVGSVPDSAGEANTSNGQERSGKRENLQLAAHDHPETVEAARKTVIAAFNRWYEAKRTEDAESAINLFEIYIHEAIDALIARVRAEVERQHETDAGKLLLNAYGRRCYRAGQESVRAEGAAQIETLTAFAQKVDAIRRDIIGRQTISWSAHVYPLVAALHEAGYESPGYEEAKKGSLTLIDLVKAAESRAEAAEARVAALEQQITVSQPNGAVDGGKVSRT